METDNILRSCTNYSTYIVHKLFYQGETVTLSITSIMERQLINSCIKYHDGFVGQTIGPTNSLMFHSYKINVILKI